MGGSGTVASCQSVIVGGARGDQFVSQQPRAVGAGSDGNVIGRKPGGIRAQGSAAAADFEAAFARCRAVDGPSLIELVIEQDAVLPTSTLSGIQAAALKAK